MNLFKPVTGALTADIELDPIHHFPGRRRWLAFTLIELLVVISIIALLASLVVALASSAAKSQKRGRIQAELNQVMTAIDAYKAHFGHYPPDNVTPATKIVNPAVNPLFYELTGVTIEERSGGMFRARDRQQGISSAIVQNYFHMDGFVNAGTNPKELKSFISLKASQRRAISSQSPGPEIEVLAVSVDWPRNNPKFPPPFNTAPGVNPWRYVKTNPTNNPSSFDLWAEFVEGGKIKIISNWSKDVLDR